MAGTAHPQWIRPDWDAPGNVHALITTRAGGVSEGPFGSSGAGGMNVGLKSGDALARVRENRALLRRCLPEEPCWLQQVHGATVAFVDESEAAASPADAAVSLRQGRVCVVSVADCLPVLFADRAGRAVGVAHAGWRGLAAGVLQETAQAMRARMRDPQAELLAFLGPAIGPQRFEVGAEVLDAMRTRLPQAAAAFAAQPSGKYLCDLFALARMALAQSGVERISGGGVCTHSDPQRFYSFRRDRITGRHAALIWLGS